jgi:tyrosyl-tRNA synthetase
MTLFDELQWRGLVYQATHEKEIADLLGKGPVSLYCGFDPTADSLHIGSLLPLMVLRHFQRAGHKVVPLVGGATGMIGDPSGKSDERQLLDREQIERNVAGIRSQIARFLDFEGDNPATLTNNADWLDGFNLVTFLRDIAKHFSVNVMMSRESVRARLEDRDHGISFTEFSYSLLQAYDFLHLHDTEGCRLQVGGSDQWGNIVSGTDLIRRLRQEETYGLTFPLVEKSDGTKFGKTETGTVWLDPERTSPYKFYQFWINSADADVIKYLKYFTTLDQDAIAEQERAVADAPERRESQRLLAEEVTRLVHGEGALENAVRASKAMFGGELTGLDDATLEDIFSEVPSSELPRTKLGEEALLLDTLADASVGVFKSKGEGRKMIQNGGLYLNNQRVEGLDAKLTEASLSSERIAVIRKGKKNYHLLKFV